jgi:hypothetical protein
VVGAPAYVTNAVAIANSSGLSSLGPLALRADGTVVSWGQNAVPLDLPFATAVTVGYNFSMAIVRSDEAVSPPVITFPPTPGSQTVVVGGATFFL